MDQDVPSFVSHLSAVGGCNVSKIVMCQKLCDHFPVCCQDVPSFVSKLPRCPIFRQWGVVVSVSISLFAVRISIFWKQDMGGLFAVNNYVTYFVSKLRVYISFWVYIRHCHLASVMSSLYRSFLCVHFSKLPTFGSGGSIFWKQAAKM